MNKAKTRWAVAGIAGFAALALVWAVGCASHSEPKTSTRPGSGIAEFRVITTDAEKAIRRALDALAAVEAQSNQCSPQVLSAFSNEVHRLQVESVQVRARSQAMQARGDAYFQQWHNNMAHVTDPKVRALAETRRPLLQQSFRQIKATSQEAREAFNPFLASLRQLRNGLEKDPAGIALESTHDQIKKAREDGNHVDQCLSRITTELDSMSAMITPVQDGLSK